MYVRMCEVKGKGTRKGGVGNIKKIARRRDEVTKRVVHITHTIENIRTYILDFLSS